MDRAKTSPTAGRRAAPASSPRRPGASTEVYKVAVGDAPTKGGKQPKVTIVEFSDFQCPFCSRVEPDARASWSRTTATTCSSSFRHNPLPFHNNAMPAALAAEAAREQGKFWEMHDKLFANQQTLDAPSLEKYAQELGLNMGKFKAALDKEKGKDRVKTRHGRRRQVRRARHAQLLHQRPQLPRRAAARGVQGRHRRGAQEGRRQAGVGRRRADSSTPR